MSDNAELEAAMTGGGIIAKPRYLRWARSKDLSTRARAYALSATAWDRIQPEPSMVEQCEAMAGYLLECLATDPPTDGFIHSASTAGHELAAWLKHLSGNPEARGLIAAVATRLEALYKRSDPKGRDRIGTGALEHMLESSSLRPFFAHWQEDPALAEAYEPALRWGLAHSEGPPDAHG
jgi:hypothetical protein